MKKFLALVLALTMALALSATAWASEAPTVTGNSASVTITTVLAIPKIEVTFGTAPQMIVNPYKMSVKFTYNSTETTSTDSVISYPSYFLNKSDVSLTVNATPKFVSSNVTYSSVDNSDTGTVPTTPTVFLKLYMAATGADSSLIDTTSGGTDLNVGESTTSSSSITVDASSGTNKYGVFQVSGKSYGTGWISGENGSSFSIQIVFTFEPTAGGNYSVTNYDSGTKPATT